MRTGFEESKKLASSATPGFVGFWATIDLSTEREFTDRSECIRAGSCNGLPRSLETTDRYDAVIFTEMPSRRNWRHIKSWERNVIGTASERVDRSVHAEMMGLGTKRRDAILRSHGPFLAKWKAR